MSRTPLVFLATLGSVALLGGAFLFQALGWQPCAICLWQRWPHGAAIVIGVLALATGWRWLGLGWRHGGRGDAPRSASIIPGSSVTGGPARPAAPGPAAGSAG